MMSQVDLLHVIVRSLLQEAGSSSLIVDQFLEEDNQESGLDF